MQQVMRFRDLTGTEIKEWCIHLMMTGMSENYKPFGSLSRRGFLATSIAAVSVASTGCLGDGDGQTETDVDVDVTGTGFTVHLDPACGCCGEYANYLERETELDVERIHVDNSERFSRFDFPEHLRSCHTTTVELSGVSRVVEGHVPLEAYTEASDSEVETLAMPGMPPGSPGMGGRKQEPFTVYMVKDTGETDVFTEI